jgi:hypothetical protein
MMPKSFAQAGLAAIAVAVGTTAAAPAWAATLVGTELVLSVDVSSSINLSEFNLQRQSYANAFRDPDVIDLIAASPNGIAVTFQYWASTTFASLGWFHLQDGSDANAFANAIASAADPGSGATNIAQAITSATSLLLNNDFVGERLIIDVSGDGRQNTNWSGSANCAPYVYWGQRYNNDFASACLNPLISARNSAIAHGITINGLPIRTDIANLDSYYQAYVAGGEDSFVQPASSFSDFDQALKTKLLRELSQPEPEPQPEPDPQPEPEPEPPASDPVDVPEPSLLLGLLGVGYWGHRLRRREVAATARD